MSRRILITGGAGFIGSHTAVVLLEAGHELVVLDSFENSSPEALRRVKELSGSNALTVIEGDVRDPEALDQAFRSKDTIDGVIHFAGLKAVGESVSDPLRYWDVNVSGSRALATAMERHGCRAIGSAALSTVYGEPEIFPCGRTCPRHRCTPTPRRSWRSNRCCRRSAAAVRGAWPACGTSTRWEPTPAAGSVRTPSGSPTTLSFMTQVAAGRRERLRVFGDDYPTYDGTGIRDYIHVMDLAEAHAVTLITCFSSQPKAI